VVPSTILVDCRSSDSMIRPHRCTSIRRRIRLMSVAEITYGKAEKIGVGNNNVGKKVKYEGNTEGLKKNTSYG
jgi:hypothetical protein